MDRIVIIGCSGGGKSTIARELSKILGIEVIHLDTVLWKPGCRLSDEQEEPQAVRELLRRPRWIMDGNYTLSLPMRLAEADTVVVVDFSRFRCLVRALKRLVQYRGKTRPDMGGDCPEELNFQFLRWIWKYPHTERPALLKLMRDHGSHAAVVFLRTPDEVENWLAALREKNKQTQSNRMSHAGRSN